jgi:hypothetical protein
MQNVTTNKNFDVWMSFSHGSHRMAGYNLWGWFPIRKFQDSMVTLLSSNLFSFDKMISLTIF